MPTVVYLADHEYGYETCTGVTVNLPCIHRNCLGVESTRDLYKHDHNPGKCADDNRPHKIIISAGAR